MEVTWSQQRPMLPSIFHIFQEFRLLARTQKHRTTALQAALQVLSREPQRRSQWARLMSKVAQKSLMYNLRNLSKAGSHKGRVSKM